MEAKRAEVTISSIKDYVRLMNTFFQLTEMEVDVLCEFIKEKIKRANDDSNSNAHLFHHSVKRRISRDEFNRSHHHWINGYIMNLKEKGALIPLEEEGHYKINRGLVPTGEGKIIIDINWKTNSDA